MYVRNGSVVDLQIAASQITVLVSGSEIYAVKVENLPVTSRVGSRSAKIARARSIRWSSFSRDGSPKA